jgi:tetratricopeptide (TPR) repeat protein
LVAGVVLPTALLVLHTHCRATFVVFSAYVFFFWVLPRFSKLGRLWLCVGLLAVGGFCLPLTTGQLAEINRKDIRIPCWTQTARLMLEHPLLGVGPGNFRREFAAVRSIAQKARAVASNVTEHPHNEVLHVFVELGLPLGMIWALLLLPLLWPKRRSGIWGVIHFSACMLFGHALFDKVLVQPPDSLLAYCLLGLLWRPLLPVRACPKFCKQALRPVILLVASVAVVWGGFVGWQQVRSGWVLRQATITADRNQPLRAYEAYRRSAEIEPANVRSHTLAGMYAINRLRKPRLALEHLLRAVRLEPDYAHVNGQIGLTLGTLGRHKDALPFFEREAQLYPFSGEAHQQLYVCRLLTGATRGIDGLVEKLAVLRYRQAVQRLGEFETKQKAVALRQAFACGDCEAATRLMVDLLGANVSRAFEPGYQQMVRRTGWVPVGTGAGRRCEDRRRDAGAVGTFKKGGGRESAKRELSASEMTLWQQWCFWRREVRRQNVRTASDLLRVYQQLAGAGRLPEGQSPLYAMAMLARQAGFRVAVLKTDSGNCGILEIRCDGKSWLANPATGVLRPGRVAEQLSSDVALARELGLPNQQKLVRLLPLHPLEFKVKAQAVGQVLRQALGEVAPLIGEPPTMALLGYRRSLARDPRGAGQGGVLPRLAYDPYLWLAGCRTFGNPCHLGGF